MPDLGVFQFLYQVKELLLTDFVSRGYFDGFKFPAKLLFDLLDPVDFFQIDNGNGDA